MTLLLLTGKRRDELAHARWRDVDFAKKLWTIPDPKNAIDEIVPLPEWAIEAFLALKRLAGDSPWVLPKQTAPEHHVTPKDLSGAVKRCLGRARKLGIEPFTLHDLRRTMRTKLSELRVPHEVKERLLNHKVPDLI